MVCLYCGGKTQVINSRLQKRPNQVWRRRNCLVCGATFSTHETASYEGSWRVLGNKGQLVPFLKNKLFVSLYESCGHRPDALQDALALTETIIARLRPLAREGTIDTQQIIINSLDTLKHFDKAAAVHFQAFHPITDSKK